MLSNNPINPDWASVIESATSGISAPKGPKGDTGPPGTYADGWTTITQPTSLSFDVDGDVITFEGKELIRLKEMLTSWTKENHPEDLL